MTSAILHRLVLRSDFDVYMNLPRDLTQREAQRICAWIMTLANPWPEKTKELKEETKP